MTDVMDIPVPKQVEALVEQLRIFRLMAPALVRKGSLTQTRAVYLEVALEASIASLRKLHRLEAAFHGR